jgi:hypothetical protein
MDNLKPADICTPEVLALVAKYLVARAFAEVTREAVDEIARAVLSDVALYNDRHADPDNEPARIIDPQRTYLSADNAALKRYWRECDRRERKAGIKPATMPADYCPALVAEDELRLIKRALIDASGKPWGIDTDRILQGRDGLANLEKWLDLVTGLAFAWEKESDNGAAT